MFSKSVTLNYNKVQSGDTCFTKVSMMNSLGSLSLHLEYETILTKFYDNLHSYKLQYTNS